MELALKISVDTTELEKAVSLMERLRDLQGPPRVIHPQAATEHLARVGQTAAEAIRTVLEQNREHICEALLGSQEQRP